ncbi:hypothetical protein [Fundicoccus culcitae]|uniref:Uncharacterized protein n=1 Tax=Fundicoccus culcitae TaxID=2969821 RepID=A0ABY5P5T7_9LACT|nr:hypothetical protein [Fundicoccus culcitae]UUX34112.1 hypothetical protein NRE15_00125 [Fundicoccus culcitae]
MNDKQFITYSINLADKDNPFLDQFEINLFLHVDRSRIATDIRTSFPYLMQKDREKIDAIAQEAYDHFLSQEDKECTLNQLSHIQALIDCFQTLLIKAYANDAGIMIESIAVALYIETFQSEFSLKKKLK